MAGMRVVRQLEVLAPKGTMRNRHAGQFQERATRKRKQRAKGSKAKQSEAKRSNAKQREATQSKEGTQISR
jgi:hypothetical protein